MAGAWAHADGNGFSIQLETVPLDGRVALRIAAKKNTVPIHAESVKTETAYEN